MPVAAVVEWFAFVVLSFVAIAGALGMTTTMSMFRSGTFLMASFIGVAGLFVLLGADLIGLLQVMMYVGGMLVMILFMVLFSRDPGGAMMTSRMDLPPLERLFSRGLKREDGGGAGGERGTKQEDLSMFSPIKKWARWLSIAAAAALLFLLGIARPWRLSDAAFDHDSARRIGELLMGRYMIAFEGAGLLILLGIFAAVFLQRPAQHPDPADRECLEAAVDAPPAPIADEPLSEESQEAAQ